MSIAPMIALGASGIGPFASLFGSDDDSGGGGCGCIFLLWLIMVLGIILFILC